MGLNIFKVKSVYESNGPSGGCWVKRVCDTKFLV